MMITETGLQWGIHVIHFVQLARMEREFLIQRVKSV